MVSDGGGHLLVLFIDGENRKRWRVVLSHRIQTFTHSARIEGSYSRNINSKCAKYVYKYS